MSAQNKRSAGGQFSDAETAELLRIIRARKPVGADGWKHVEDDFNAVAAQTPGFQERGKLSLKQKFNRLVTMQKPTGEGEMPALNRLALEIQQEIHAEIDAGEAGDDDVLGEHVLDQSLAQALNTGPSSDSHASTQETVAAVENVFSPVGSAASAPSPMSRSMVVPAFQSETWSASRNARDSLRSMSDSVKRLAEPEAPTSLEKLMPQMLMMQMQMSMQKAQQMDMQMQMQMQKDAKMMQMQMQKQSQLDRLLMMRLMGETASGGAGGDWEGSPGKKRKSDATEAAQERSRSSAEGEWEEFREWRRRRVVEAARAEEEGYRRDLQCKTPTP
jgi:hypothetical protein